MSNRPAIVPHPLGGLGRATTVALAVVGGINVVQVLLVLFGVEQTGPVVGAANVLVIAGWAITAVLFIVWLYRARENLERRGETGMGWKQGWTIGGWFIPIANLIIPNRVVAEIYARSKPGAFRTWTTPRIINAWWVALVLSILRFQTTSTYLDSTTHTIVQQTHTPAPIAIMNAVAGAVAAVLAVSIVRQASAWHDAWRPPAE